MNLLQRKNSYHDYMAWPDDERVELIDREPYYMSPAPSRKHQNVSRELLTEFNLYLRGKTCQIYDAPFDVRLFAEDVETIKLKMSCSRTWLCTAILKNWMIEVEKEHRI